MNHQTRFHILAVLIGLSACVSPPPPPPIDPYGCQPPQPSVFKKVGVDLNFAQSTFGNLVLGTIDVKAKPEVVSLASQAATDAQIIEYMRCLALRRDGYSLEQVTYLQELIAFTASTPTPGQFIEWKLGNRFPGSFPTAAQAVNISIPAGWTFKQAAWGVAKIAKVAVEFDGFSNEELLVLLPEVRLQASTYEKLLGALRNYANDKLPQYDVSYDEPGLSPA